MSSRRAAAFPTSARKSIGSKAAAKTHWKQSKRLDYSKRIYSLWKDTGISFCVANAGRHPQRRLDDPPLPAEALDRPSCDVDHFPERSRTATLANVIWISRIAGIKMDAGHGARANPSTAHSVGDSFRLHGRCSWASPCPKQSNGCCRSCGKLWGYDMMQTARLTSASADFEQMITQFRNRLRPPPALTLADWLRVHVGLSSTEDDPRESLDFPPPRVDVHRQLRAVLRAVS
jgi:hypothetical protein